MLKLNASYSKKVWGEVDGRSEGFQASIESELSDGLTAEQIQGKIHDTFELVRTSVEEEINGQGSNAQNQNVNPPVDNRNQNRSPRPFRKGGNGQPASEKQKKLLFDLGNRTGVRINDLVGERFNLSNHSELTKSQCSNLIDELVRRDNKAA
jgi:hypothetical protein